MMPRVDDDDLRPEVRLDEDFVRAAPVKEKSARQRRKKWERAGLAPGRRRGLRIGGLRLRDWLIPMLVVAGGWVYLGLPAPFGQDGGTLPAVETTDTTVAAGAVPGETTSTTFALVGRDYRPGHCVTWDQSEERRGGLRPTRIVSCDEPHLIEITGRHQRPLIGAYPSEVEWDDIIDNGECGRLAREYLGGQIDPYGRFTTGALRPLPDSWRDGDRTVWCGVQSTGRGEPYVPDTLSEFTGAVRAQPQTFLYAAGTCLGVETGTNDLTGPVRCTEPHGYEIVGPIDVGARFTTLPGENQWFNRGLGDDCERLARTALGGRLPAGVQISVFPIDEASWRTGRRTTECAVARFDAADNPVTVTGPLRGKAI